MQHLPILFAAGLLAGAMNAVAGGGSFVTLPALLVAGLPSVAANASSTVALFPASFASAFAYREYFRGFEQISMPLLLGITLSGGLAGALLLLLTPVATFDHLLPWLILIGAMAFAFGRRIGAAIRRRIRIGPATFLFGQFLLSIYAGYFGGAVGIMMLAVWSLLGITDLRAMNAAKALLVGSANGVAVICFVLAGLVWWRETVIMLLAGVIGGYGGARATRSVDPERIRQGIVVFNFLLTAGFFYRTYT